MKNHRITERLSTKMINLRIMKAKTGKKGKAEKMLILMENVLN